MPVKKGLTGGLLLTLVLLMVGCSPANGEKEAKAFTEEAAVNLRKQAVSYSKEELMADTIPLNTFIKVTGKITATDTSDGQVDKGARFKLNSEGYDIQIFNEQEKVYQVGDEVTVYGEYYGFIKGAVIDATENQ